MKVKLKKYFLEGTLEGLTVEDSVSFPSFDYAERWAASVNRKTDVPYVVTELTNPETGEKVAA